LRPVLCIYIYKGVSKRRRYIHIVGSYKLWFTLCIGLRIPTCFRLPGYTTRVPPPLFLTEDIDIECESGGRKQYSDKLVNNYCKELKDKRPKD
jgi:hypothetical protein